MKILPILAVVASVLGVATAGTRTVHRSVCPTYHLLAHNQLIYLRPMQVNAAGQPFDFAERSRRTEAFVSLSCELDPAHTVEPVCKRTTQDPP